MTPLHWAVEREHEEMIHVLLDNGADANAISKFDKTPISLALEHDRLDLVDILQQEREILNVKAQQQRQANSAEIEEATHSLMQMQEAERKQEEQQRQFEIEQLQQRKQAVICESLEFLNTFVIEREYGHHIRNFWAFNLLINYKNNGHCEKSRTQK